MRSTSAAFKENASRALRDPGLQRALHHVGEGFVQKRKRAIEALPEFELLRRRATAVKEHSLAHLDRYLEQFEREVVARGGQVHWARTPEEASRIVLDICQDAGARRIAKGKSMVGEEIDLNRVLEQAGMETVETDLGEYIIQLAEEPPSHIIAPAIHKTADDIARLFRQHHGRYGMNAPLDSPREIVDEARQVLRQAFVRADVGITGANFLVAETGSTVLVTNEGNGDLSATLPRVHIALAGLEKVVPTLADAQMMLRLLTRSATGQETTAYTTWHTGPRRPQDPDGPEAFHVVLLDNGRTGMLGGKFHDMLRCIRCGACLNHCPVYGAIGGHAYGWVYPGPMGSVLTPMMRGLEEAGDLPNASTLCGRCEQVCPMSIPLPDMLRQLRQRQHAMRLDAPRGRMALWAWGALARSPVLYRSVFGLAARALALLGRRRGALRRLPWAGGWTAARDLPSPQGQTFQTAWRRSGGARR